MGNKAELLIRATSRAQSLDNLTYTGKRIKKVTAQAKETQSKREKLDIETLMGALGMCRLSPLKSNLMVAKYQDQRPEDLEDQIHTIVLDNWRGPPLDTSKATKLILAEFLHSHICPCCEGSGLRMGTDPDKTDYGKIVDCGGCRNGVRKPSDRGRAEFFKIAQRTWLRRYSAPYSQIQYIINDYLDKSEVKFERKLG